MATRLALLWMDNAEDVSTLIYKPGREVRTYDAADRRDEEPLFLAPTKPDHVRDWMAQNLGQKCMVEVSIAKSIYPGEYYE